MTCEYIVESCGYGSGYQVAIEHWAFDNDGNYGNTTRPIDSVVYATENEALVAMGELLAEEAAQSGKDLLPSLKGAKDAAIAAAQAKYAELKAAFPAPVANDHVHPIFQNILGNLKAVRGM